MNRLPTLSIAVAGFAVATVGCAPALPKLVADKHYREALCAATDGSDEDRRLVADALAKDVDVHAHVHPVTLDELRPSLGNAAEAVHARARFARVIVQTNLVPIDRLQIGTSLRAESGAFAGAPVTWESLAWATQEKLPPKRQVETSWTANNILGGLVSVFTAGVAAPFWRWNTGVRQVDAPLQEYVQMAPVAVALQTALPRDGCRSLAPIDARGAALVGYRCEWVFVLNASRDAPLVLEVRTRHVALRDGVPLHEANEQKPEEVCKLGVTSTLRLGRTSELEAVTAKRFGGRMRSLAELGAETRAPAPERPQSDDR